MTNSNFRHKSADTISTYHYLLQISVLELGFISVGYKSDLPGLLVLQLTVMDSESEMVVPVCNADFVVGFPKIWYQNSHLVFLHI